MNTQAITQFGYYIMLCSIFAAMFRQQEILLYGMFAFGFLLAILPIDARTIPLRGILVIAISCVALQTPLHLSQSLPGLVRLGISIAIWTLVLIFSVWICSIVTRKWANNDTRQTSE